MINNIIYEPAMWSYSQAYVSMRILWTNVYRSNSSIILIYRATQFFRQSGDYCTTKNRVGRQREVEQLHAQ